MAGTLVTSRRGKIAIESVQPGDRVVTYLDGDSRQSSEPDMAVDSATWRLFHLELAKSDGGAVTIALLRPSDWLAQLDRNANGQVLLTLPELDAVGYAQVVAIEPCPAIASGPGRAVA